jgi:hypothetical protein
MSSDAQANKFLSKIKEKSKQLRENGLTRDDQDLLKDHHRLEIIWGESTNQPDVEDSTATIWRKSRARRVYREIQDADNHLLLVRDDLQTSH